MKLTAMPLGEKAISRGMCLHGGTDSFFLFL